MWGNIISMTDVAKFEKNSPKLKYWGARSKWGKYVPVIRWDIAMVTALIRKLTTKT